MKKILLIAALAAACASMNAQDYTVTKLWGTDNVPASDNCRQGVGIQGYYYINHRGAAATDVAGEIAPYVMVYGPNGLTNQQFPGGPNCGINSDQAGNLIVSLATFPAGGSWIFDDETEMIRVINPATSIAADVPLSSFASNENRLDVLGRAYGDMLNGDGALYLPGRTADGVADGSIRAHFYSDSELLGEDCYSPLLDPAPNADNMTIVSAVVDADGNDAVFYYQRGANPYLYYFNGDNLEGEQINIPATADGIMRCNQNGSDFFAHNGKNFVVYPCGLTNNAYYDGFAIYEVGADAPLFVKEPTVAVACNTFQANWLNAEVNGDEITIYQYVPGKSIEVYSMTPLATAVNDVHSQTVSNVTYVNAAGMVSDTAFEGVNVKVTTYSDGNKSAVKVVK